MCWNLRRFGRSAENGIWRVENGHMVKDSQKDNDVCVSGRHCLINVGKDRVWSTCSWKLANIQHGKIADLFPWSAGKEKPSQWGEKRFKIRWILPTRELYFHEFQRSGCLVYHRRKLSFWCMNPCFKEKKHQPAKYERSEVVRGKSHRSRPPVRRDTRIPLYQDLLSRANQCFIWINILVMQRWSILDELEMKRKHLIRSLKGNFFPPDILVTNIKFHNETSREMMFYFCFVFVFATPEALNHQ